MPRICERNHKGKVRIEITSPLLMEPQLSGQGDGKFSRVSLNFCQVQSGRSPQ